MGMGVRVIAAIGVGVAVAAAAMAQDSATDAGWAVTAAQIADAKAYGKAGVEIGSGAVVTEPTRSVAADYLPFKWALAGAAAGLLVFAGAGRPRRGGSPDQ